MNQDTFTTPLDGELDGYNPKRRGKKTRDARPSVEDAISYGSNRTEG